MSLSGALRSSRALPRQLAPKNAPLIYRRYKSGPYGYTQAKALVYSSHGEPEDILSLHTHSISPSLPPKHVLLRTLASPINPADINQLQGSYPSKPPFTPLLGTPQPSAVGGNEGCFEVVSSSSSSPLQKGQWVITSGPNLGTWRTHLLVKEDEVVAVDKEGLTPVQVGTVGVNPCTAYRMLKDFEGGVTEGEWFIQNGANSGVGRAAIQFGRLWGVKSINIIRDRDDAAATQKLKDELVELGATKVVTESELMNREFGDQVKEWTNGGREHVKIGLNCVGGKPTTALIRNLSSGGHLVTYGGMSKQPVMLPTAALIFKDIRFSGFWVSRWGDKHRGERKRTVDEILDLVRRGEFKDTPTQELTWNWDTQENLLKDAVKGTLSGFRAGKSVFVFGDT